jgi:hypothetical protein
MIPAFHNLQALAASSGRRGVIVSIVTPGLKRSKVMIFKVLIPFLELTAPKWL